MGNLQDVFYITIMIFALGVFFMLMFTVYNGLKPGLDDHFVSDVALNATASAETALANFDYLLILVFVGLVVAVMISAFFIQTHPVFFVISLLVLILFGLFIPILGNVFDAFATNTNMAVAADEYNVTISFMDDLPKYFVVICILIMIILYAKFKTGGGEL